MVNAVASRVIPRQRVSRAMAREAAAEAARMKELARAADAPSSVGRIPSRAGDSFRAANVGLRPMGNSRRIFLLDPHMEAAEMEGLAHRIHALTNNGSINSVLIASDDTDDMESNCLPRYLTEMHTPHVGLNMDFDPSPGSTWHVSGGYDPLKVAESKDEDESKYLLESLRKLALATKGEVMGSKPTHVPVITMPHGMVSDGGYALCTGSYVLATRQTFFRILNPSRGLSFDPVGFSYILPRLGFDNKQRSSKHKGCGWMLALAGYEANCFDMVETGLATHLVSDSASLPLLEENLATIVPWDQQKLVVNPRRYYGESIQRDPNARFRNKTIAYLIEQLSEHAANTNNSLPYDFTITNAGDPALDTDHIPWDSGFFSSELVDTAALFDPIFNESKSVEEIMESLRQRASTNASNVEDKENSKIAKDLVTQMEQQSPLSLRVVYQLMSMGIHVNETFEECSKREMWAQRNMFQHDDFKNWAAHVRKHGSEATAPAFGGWKHKNVSEVTANEVDAIIQAN